MDSSFTFHQNNGTTTRLQTKTQKRIAAEQLEQDAELKRQKPLFAPGKIIGPRDIFIDSKDKSIKVEGTPEYSSVNDILKLEASPSEKQSTSFTCSDLPKIKLEVDLDSVVKLEETLEMDESICIGQSVALEFVQQHENYNIETQETVVPFKTEPNQNKFRSESEGEIDDTFLQNHIKLLKALVQQKDLEINLLVQSIEGLQLQSKTLDSTLPSTKSEKYPIDTYNFSTDNSDATTFPSSQFAKQLALVLNGKDIVIRQLTTKMLTLQEKIFGKDERSLEIIKNYQPYFDCTKLSQLLIDEMRCVQCRQICKSKMALERHTIFQHTKRTIPCPNCKEKFHTEAQLNKHIKKHADFEEWNWQCKVCQKKFVRIKTFNKHLKTHIPIQSDPKENGPLEELWECSNDSEQEIESERGLEIDELTSHTQDLRQFACDTCRKKCKSTEALNSHFEKCNDLKHWKLECPKCSRKFANEWRLYSHLRKKIHNSERHVPVSNVT